jgi:hypothetical protein
MYFSTPALIGTNFSVRVDRRKGNMVVENFSELRSSNDIRSNRINVLDVWERQYWCAKFRISEQLLLDAVKAVGADADTVRAHLARTL